MLASHFALCASVQGLHSFFQDTRTGNQKIYGIFPVIVEKEFHICTMNFSSKAEWEQELNRLKAFFQKADIPAPGKHVIDPAITVTDLKKAIHTYVIRAEENVGNPIFQGTIVGLQAIEQYILKQSSGNSQSQEKP